MRGLRLGIVHEESTRRIPAFVQIWTGAAVLRELSSGADPVVQCPDAHVRWAEWRLWLLDEGYRAWRSQRYGKRAHDRMPPVLVPRDELCIEAGYQSGTGLAG